MTRHVVEIKCFLKTRLQKNIAAFLRVLRSCAAFLFACVLMNGCSLSFPSDDRLKDRDPRIQQMAEQQETVRGDKDPPLVKLHLGKKLRPANLRPSDDLPSNIKIGATNLNNVPVTSALQAVLADTDITLLWESSELQDRKVTLLNLKGALPVVVTRICRAAKVLCAYRNGALELSENDTFVVELPGVANSGAGAGGSSASNTIADSITALIDGKVKADSAGGNLIYTTNAEGHERVQGYLDQLRNGRPLIVMQLYIWQVSLDENKRMGINWKDFKIPSVGGLSNVSSSSALSSVTGGVSLGAVLSGAVDVNLLAGFLATQGKVQNISSPQLTFVSGTSAKFEVGDSERYVSQVGTLTNSTVAGTGSTSSSNNNTVNTEELKTGLQILVSGSYESGVVFSNLEIKTSDFIQFTKVPTGSTELQLPKTSNRSVQTVLRVRPGDNLVLAGLQTSREDQKQEGLPAPDLLGGMVPTYGSGVAVNSELVLMVKPSVVFFSDKEMVDTVTEPAKPVDESAAKPIAAIKDDAPSPVLPAAPPTAPPVAPNALQNEFRSAVKEFEGLHLTQPLEPTMTQESP